MVPTVQHRYLTYFLWYGPIDTYLAIALNHKIVSVLFVIVPTIMTVTESASISAADEPDAFVVDPASLLPFAGAGGKSTPQPNRAITKATLHALLWDSLRPTPSNVHGSGPLLVSDVPKSSKNNGGVIMGIDEAGRGPALGPMTYAAAYWHPSTSSSIPKDFNDSKQLTPEKRQSLFQKIQCHPDIGFLLRVIHASEISRNMLRKTPYNLNAMSHDAAISMIWAVLQAGIKIDTCYVDTVGIANSYQTKLEQVFEGHNIHFVVEKKADAKYAPCSAASVIAKESRDAIVSNWKWTEFPNYTPQNGQEFGSGYPSDPKTVEWMKQNCNVNTPFGYPDFVRFSWGPTKKSLGEGPDNNTSTTDSTNNNFGPHVKWEADEDGDNNNDGGAKQSSIQSYVVTKKVEDTHNNDNGGKKAVMQQQRKKPRLAIFNELGISKVVVFA